MILIIPVQLLLLALIFLSIKASRSDFDLTNYYILRFLPYFILMIPLWIFCHSVAGTPLLLETRTVEPSSMFDLKKYPVSISIFFLIMPILFVSFSLYYGLDSNRIINESFIIYLSIVDYRSKMIAAGAPSPSDLKYLALSLKKLSQLQSEVLLSWSRMWTTYIIASSIELIVSVMTYLYIFFTNF